MKKKASEKEDIYTFANLSTFYALGKAPKKIHLTDTKLSRTKIHYRS